jgi:hypothetical protein
VRWPYTIISYRVKSNRWQGRLTSSTRGLKGHCERSRPQKDWGYTVLERCNTHTRFAYEVVRKECERLGLALPPGHESAFNENVLRVEEEEFRRADRLLCPSDFVVKTFLERGFPESQLVRHIYGFDEKVYYPSSQPRETRCGLTMLFVVFAR